MYPNVAKVGWLQSQGVKGEAVVAYCDPLTTQDLKSSGFPDGPLPQGPKGQQQGKIEPILGVHRWGYPKTIALATILEIITNP